MTEFDKLLNKLQRQFLCCYPNIDWQEVHNISWEQQEQLVEATYGHILNKEQPVKIAYQLNFLKRLLQQLEENVSEVHDIVYESYCEVQKQAAQDATKKYAYKHYMLPEYKITFSLRESKSFVAEGTTGLCSWQASMALADFFLAHPELVQNKSVIELGAGTGLCGCILSACCGVRKMLLTDGSMECVELMRETALKNIPKIREEPSGAFTIGEQELNIKPLLWDEIESYSDLLAEAAPEILIAADVVYDDRVFDDLTHAIDFIFSTTSCTQMYLAATVRNECTLQKFLNLLDKLNFHIEDRIVASEENSFLYWDRRTPIRILSITRRNGCD